MENQNDNLLLSAVQRNNPKTIKILLQDCKLDPSDHNNAAIRLASLYGYQKIVKFC